MKFKEQNVDLVVGKRKVAEDKKVYSERIPLECNKPSVNLVFRVGIPVGEEVNLFDAKNIKKTEIPNVVNEDKGMLF